MTDFKTDLNKKLREVRKYTGDRFSVARGYDARKRMSKARARTIAKYYDAIQELTSRAHMVITPKKGTKREVFSYTGQLHYPRFTKAILDTPDETARYTWQIDKSRPKGSRFTLINKRTKQKSWHIPARVFLDENEHLYDEDEDIPDEFFIDIIREYGVEAEAYMIEAGDNHMWGDAGHPELVGKKLAQLFKEYGADRFNRFDKGSHFIGNWFNGIRAFTAAEWQAYAAKAVVKAQKREETWGLARGQHFRVLKSGDLALFYRGKMTHIFKPHEFAGTQIVSKSEYGIITVENDDTS